jgi:PIN domain nuclease of toxin-antitoxin system
MILLLDTHVFIWMDSQPTQLSASAAAALQDPSNTLLVSAASIWEMVIKIQLGKLTLRLPLRNIVSEQQSNRISILPVRLSHALAVDQLPSIHRDPFDRMVIAQANIEGAEMVTADHVFSQDPVRLLW